MILHCSYEELSALNFGARQVLEKAEEGAAAAPFRLAAEIEPWLSRWTGDVSLTSLAEAEALERVVAAVAEELRETLEGRIAEEGVGGEGALTAYFDFGHVYELLHRVRRLAAQMRAMIEIMTGRPPTPETARSVAFPD